MGVSLLGPKRNERLGSSSVDLSVTMIIFPEHHFKDYSQARRNASRVGRTKRLRSHLSGKILS